jgi:hypothetical protein
MTATAIDRAKARCFGPGRGQIDRFVFGGASRQIRVGAFGAIAARAAILAVRVAVLLAPAAFEACQTVDVHGEVVETTAPPSCMDCHGHDYLGTSAADGKDPAPLDHVKAGIGTACADCHSKEAWRPAVAAGHAFPIEAGVHKAACVICHNQPTQFSAFTCSTGFCHPHFKLKKQHSKVADFTTESGACLHCHPEGK